MTDWTQERHDAARTAARETVNGLSEAKEPYLVPMATLLDRVWSRVSDLLVHIGVMERTTYTLRSGETIYLDEEPSQ